MIKEDNFHKPFIVNEGGYTEVVQINTVKDGLVNVSIDIPKAPNEEYRQRMWDVVNKFETTSWSDKSLGIKTGFECLDKAFDGGIKNGFVIIAGDSNLGKTAVLSQLEHQVVTNNENVYVMSFSLDDPMNDKIPRIVASRNKVLINAVKTPKRYTQYPMMLVRRLEGLNTLRKETDKYALYDSTFSTNVEDIQNEILAKKQYFESIGQDKQIVVFIDNFHDLTVKSRSFPSENEKYDFIAQWCSDIATNVDIPLIASGELKKTNTTNRPVSDDIRTAVKIKYEAKAIILVYNEVHYKAEGAKVYFNRKGVEQKQPIMELHFAKNKMSTYKGRLFYEFYPDLARLEPVSNDQSRSFINLIYG